jgi:hypothetical protein
MTPVSLPQSGPLDRSYRIRRVPCVAIIWAARLLTVALRRPTVRPIPQRPPSPSEFAELIGRVAAARRGGRS